MTSLTEPAREITGGADTHRDFHVAAVVDEAGRVLSSAEFPATSAGYRQMLTWMRRHGTLLRVGVEGTGAWGAGLARHLRDQGVVVIEVDRPNRQLRRRRGKSDTTDAEAAARAALNGEATGTAKSRDGAIESIRVLRVARRSALTDLDHLVAAAAPDLVACYGVGTDTAGALLVAAGDNPDRLHSEAAFAALCGVSPKDASSGLHQRHRLNRGGDRQANQALWRIVLVRMSSDPRTRAYVTRRTTEGRTKKEIIRCLKRYVARELHPHLTPQAQ